MPLMPFIAGVYQRPGSGSPDHGRRQWAGTMRFRADSYWFSPRSKSPSGILRFRIWNPR